jgi:hypothetical protein
MELLTEAGIIPQESLALLIQEANEIVSILTASAGTAQSNSRKKGSSYAQSKIRN